MALLNAAGSAGMVLGPTLAGILEVALRGRTSLPPGLFFLSLTGAAHATVAALGVSRFRAPARTSPSPQSIESQ